MTDNRPAFPNEISSGMTLRDYFAIRFAVALQGKYNTKAIVESAYAFADAMMEQRDK